MKLDDALDMLGISLTTDPDTARRAYAKLLKKHKPEVDPEGFMRLREAYETARDVLVGQAMRLAEPDVARSKAIDVALQTEMPGAVQSSTAAMGEPSVSTDERGPEISEVRGASAPPSVYDAEDEADVEAYLELGAPEDAAEVLEASFHLAIRRAIFDDLPVETALVVIFGLHERGLPEEASRLERALTACLESGQIEAREIQGELALQLRLARELCALPYDVPKPVRAVLARSAVALDLATAKDPLSQVLGGSMKRAVALADTLDAKAPLFGEALGPTLRRPPPGRWNTAALLAGAVVVVVGIVAALGVDHRHRAVIDEIDYLDKRAYHAGVPIASQVADLRAHIRYRRCAEAGRAASRVIWDLHQWGIHHPLPDEVVAATRSVEISVHGWCRTSPPERPSSAPYPVAPSLRR